MAPTGFYGYNIHKKKERKTNLRMTEPLHFVIYFFFNSTRVTTQHFVFHCYSISQKHAHTQTGRSRAMYRKNTFRHHVGTKQQSTDWIHQCTGTTDRNKAWHVTTTGPQNEVNRTFSPRVHLDGETLTSSSYFATGQSRARECFTRLLMYKNRLDAQFFSPPRRVYATAQINDRRQRYLQHTLSTHTSDR